MAQNRQTEQGHTQTSDELPSLIEAADFKATKFQIMRYDFLGDFKACAEILAVSGPAFRVIMSRTADPLGCGPMAKS